MGKVAMFCRHCGAPMEFSMAQVGQEGPCYQCGQTIRVVEVKALPGSRALAEADQLAQSGALEDAIRAYHALADAEPRTRPRCYARVGAALQKLGRHGEAIQWYQAALFEGMDAEEMERRIDEARAARDRAA